MRKQEQNEKKTGQPNLSRGSSECAGKLPGDWRQSVLQLCGSYLSQGGSEQIGANGTARVCFMSQHAAEAWAPHHRLSLASTPSCFMLESRPLPQPQSPVVCMAVKAELCLAKKTQFHTIVKKFCIHDIGFSICPCVFCVGILL